MNTLPAELILEIANFADSFTDIYNFSRSCKQVYNTIQNRGETIKRFDSRKEILARYLSQAHKFKNIEDELRSGNYKVDMTPKIVITLDEPETTTKKLITKKKSVTTVTEKKSISPLNFLLCQGDFGTGIFNSQGVVSIGGVQFKKDRLVYRMAEVHGDNINVWNEVDSPFSHPKEEREETHFNDTASIKYTSSFYGNSFNIKSVRCIESKRLWRFSPEEKIEIQNIERSAHMFKFFDNKLYLIQDSTIKCFDYSTSPSTPCTKLWTKNLSEELGSAQYHQSISLNANTIFVTASSSPYMGSNMKMSCVVLNRLDQSFVGSVPIEQFVSGTFTPILTSMHMFFVSNTKVTIASISSLIRSAKGCQESKISTQVVDLSSLGLPKSKYIGTKRTADERYIMMTYHTIGDNKPFVILIDNLTNTITTHVQSPNRPKYGAPLTLAWCLQQNGEVVCLTESFFDSMWSFIDRAGIVAKPKHIVGFETKKDLEVSAQQTTDLLILAI